MQQETVQVWDRFVRVCHWSLVLCFIGAYMTTDDASELHRWFGYATIALVSARIIWGFIGSYYARFTNFVPSGEELIYYTYEVVTRRERVTLGHNPLAAVMVISLLLINLAIGLTGWLLETDAYRGHALMQDTHQVIVHVAIAAIVLHVIAVISRSVRHRENLIKAMVNGKKPGL